MPSGEGGGVHGHEKAGAGLEGTASQCGLVSQSKGAGREAQGPLQGGQSYRTVSQERRRPAESQAEAAKGAPDPSELALARPTCSLSAPSPHFPCPHNESSPTGHPLSPGGA